MEYIDEFCNPDIASKLVKAIEGLLDKGISLMEVCGTHTVAIFKHGIKRLFSESLRLLSGPGCPVCVTPTMDVDAVIQLSREPGIILTTFGDMMRVPGSSTSLERTRADGADIRILYSPLDALKIAKENPLKKVVFFGIGFETTSPSIASTIYTAKEEGVKNFWVYSCHKLIPPAMKGLLKAGEVKIDGFICPGHVSTIIGSLPYESIAKDFKIPCVIAGFEPLDILQSIYMLLRQINEGKSEVEIQYKRSVRPEGNKKALCRLYEVFEVADSYWRGIGMIPNSGLKIREEYSQYDARFQFGIQITEHQPPITNCICGEILRGISSPLNCKFFGRECIPENPIGPCMVSSEGTCAAYYRYERFPKYKA